MVSHNIKKISGGKIQTSEMNTNINEYNLNNSKVLSNPINKGITGSINEEITSPKCNLVKPQTYLQQMDTNKFVYHLINNKVVATPITINNKMLSAILKQQMLKDVKEYYYPIIDAILLAMNISKKSTPIDEINNILKSINSVEAENGNTSDQTRLNILTQLNLLNEIYDAFEFKNKFSKKNMIGGRLHTNEIPNINADCVNNPDFPIFYARAPADQLNSYDLYKFIRSNDIDPDAPVCKINPLYRNEFQRDGGTDDRPTSNMYTTYSGQIRPNNWDTRPNLQDEIDDYINREGNTYTNVKCLEPTYLRMNDNNGRQVCFNKGTNPDELTLKTYLIAFKNGENWPENWPTQTDIDGYFITAILDNVTIPPYLLSPPAPAPALRIPDNVRVFVSCFNGMVVGQNWPGTPEIYNNLRGTPITQEQIDICTPPIPAAQGAQGAVVAGPGGPGGIGRNVLVNQDDIEEGLFNEYILYKIHIAMAICSNFLPEGSLMYVVMLIFITTIIQKMSYITRAELLEYLNRTKEKSIEVGGLTKRMITCGYNTGRDILYRSVVWSRDTGIRILDRHNRAMVACNVRDENVEIVRANGHVTNVRRNRENRLILYLKAFISVQQMVPVAGRYQERVDQLTAARDAYMANDVPEFTVQQVSRWKDEQIAQLQVVDGRGVNPDSIRMYCCPICGSSNYNQACASRITHHYPFGGTTIDEQRRYSEFNRGYLNDNRCNTCNYLCPSDIGYIPICESSVPSTWSRDQRSSNNGVLFWVGLASNQPSQGYVTLRTPQRVLLSQNDTVNFRDRNTGILSYQPLHLSRQEIRQELDNTLSRQGNQNLNIRITRAFLYGELYGIPTDQEYNAIRQRLSPSFFGWNDDLSGPGPNPVRWIDISQQVYQTVVDIRRAYREKRLRELNQGIAAAEAERDESLRAARAAVILANEVNEPGDQPRVVPVPVLANGGGGGRNEGGGRMVINGNQNNLLNQEDVGCLDIFGQAVLLYRIRNETDQAYRQRVELIELTRQSYVEIHMNPGETYENYQIRVVTTLDEITGNVNPNVVPEVRNDLPRQPQVQGPEPRQPQVQGPGPRQVQPQGPGPGSQREVLFIDRGESEEEFQNRINFNRQNNIPHVVVNRNPNEDYNIYLTRVADANERELNRQIPQGQDPRPRQIPNQGNIPRQIPNQGNIPRQIPQGQGQREVVQRGADLLVLELQIPWWHLMPYQRDTYIQRDVEYNNLLNSPHGTLITGRENERLTDEIIDVLSSYTRRRFGLNHFSPAFEFITDNIEYLERFRRKIDFNLRSERESGRENRLRVNSLEQIAEYCDRRINVLRNPQRIGGFTKKHKIYKKRKFTNKNKNTKKYKKRKFTNKNKK